MEMFMLYSIFSALSGLPIVLQDFTNEKNQLLKRVLNYPLEQTVKLSSVTNIPARTQIFTFTLLSLNQDFVMVGSRIQIHCLLIYLSGVRIPNLVSVSVRCSYLSAKSVQN